MIDALKLRRTELEDKLYDKVQELKKISLQQAVSGALYSDNVGGGESVGRSVD